MDFHISPEQRQMIASVRDLAQAEFKPKAGRWMDGTFPWENMTQLAELGVLGMAVPEEYGGLGPAGPRHRAGPRGDRQGLLRDRDGGAGRGRRADPGHRPLRARGDQASASCPRVVSGDCMLAICMTEPHAGTDVANYRTNAAHRRRPRHPERRQDADQPRADEAGMFVVFTPHRRQAGPRGHRLRAGRARHAGLRGHRHLSHDGRREPARDPVRRLRAAAGEPGDPRGRLPQAADRVQHAALPQSRRSRWAWPRARSTRR